MEQFVIVGAGQTGHCAALALRQSGFAGRIVMLGAEERPPYERPPLSKEVLTCEDDPEPKYFTTPERYADKGIEVRLGTVVEGIDRGGAVHLGNGERLAYDRLLIATGGRPRTLDIPGGGHIRYLRDFGNALAIRKELRAARRLLCIGGGVIGLEIAASAATMGCAVIVVEAGERIMNRCLAPEQTEFLAAVHRSKGVSLVLGCGVAAVERVAGGGLAVGLSNGDVEVVDMVVAGIGMVRNAELAAEAGLAVDNGILVDHLARTNDAQIHAAGDVAAFEHVLSKDRMRLESWYHAQYHGACAGRAMAGEGRPYDDVPRYWTDQYHLGIQVAGFPAEAAATTIAGDPGTGGFTALHENAAGRLIGVTAVNQPRSIRACLDIVRRGEAVPQDFLRPATT